MITSIGGFLYIHIRILADKPDRIGCLNLYWGTFLLSMDTSLVSLRPG